MSDVSTLFELLADQSRRRVLVSLWETEPITVPDDIAIPPNRPEPSPGGGQLQQARTSEFSEQFELELHHRHLPKLEEAGYVDWCRESQTVSRGPRFEESAHILRILEAHADTLPGEFV